MIRYDYDEPEVENVWIWRSDIYKKYQKETMRGYIKNEDVDLSEFNGYRKFIVLRKPIDRIISYINHTYGIAYYRAFLDNTLPIEQYIDRFFDSYPYLIDYKRPDRRFDKHAVPQRVYYENYKRLFGDQLEVVMIEDLPEYYERLTGNKFIKQNVASKEDKICTVESLTPKQKRRIEKYLAKYEFCKDDEYTRLFNS